MEVSPDMIQRFLENRCTKEEAAQVYEYLLNNKDQLNKWLPEEEWETFEAHIKLSTAESNNWFRQIETQKENGRLRTISRKWVPAAAAVLVAVGLVTAYLFMRPGPEKTIVKNNTPQVPATKEKIFWNNSSQAVSYTLDDGSIIELDANSTVVCNQPFNSTKRKLTLHGEAIFYVAKDSTRPFTVFTKGFSTTALGTTFRITAYDSSSASSVKLIEGKVVLQNLHHPAEPMYLRPGEEYSYTNNSFHNITPKVHIPVKAVVPIQVDGNITETTTEISFSNTPLPEVLKKIGELYKINIDTDSTQLEGRKFTGSFLKKQAADDVLATIAGLNNYTVEFDGTVYRLTAH